LFNKDKTELIRYPWGRYAEDYVIPPTVVKIRRMAFHASGLFSVVIPHGVTEIEEHTFSDCARLESVSLPQTVTKIGEQAFHRCLSLKSITLPLALTEIGDYAFWNTGLDSIFIPAAVEKIGEGVFDRFSNTSRLFKYKPPPPVYISVHRKNKYYRSRDGKLTERCVRELTVVFHPLLRLRKAIEAVKMSPEAFFKLTFRGKPLKEDFQYIRKHMAKTLKELDMSAATPVNNSIGKNALSGCVALTSVILPTMLKTIGAGAFSGCESLTSIDIPASVEHIDESAFADCAVEIRMMPAQ
jgi:hypothetical protein